MKASRRGSPALRARRRPDSRNDQRAGPPPDRPSRRPVAPTRGLILSSPCRTLVADHKHHRSVPGADRTVTGITLSKPTRAGMQERASNFGGGGRGRALGGYADRAIFAFSWSLGRHFSVACTGREHYVIGPDNDTPSRQRSLRAVAERIAATVCGTLPAMSEQPDSPSGLRSEDWTAVWLGAALILAVLVGVRPATPTFSWSGGAAGDVFSLGNVAAILLTGLLLLGLSAAGIRLMGSNTSAYVVGFPVVFALAWASRLIAGNAVLKQWGISYVIIALVIGLLISNVAGVPSWLQKAIRTEYYIKTGLVILGTNIVFGEVLQAGLLGVAQALAVILAVWYFCYWVSRRLGVDDEFATMLASAVSICGVSAAIATCGAIAGDRKKLSYVTSLVLIVAVPMTILMPWAVERLGMSPIVGGAWIGGTIDTSGAVVAAGEILGDSALNAAVIVKFSQNALLGLAAFAISLWWAFRAGAEAGTRPTAGVIWERFPKFVLGFIVASLLFSFVLGGELVASTGAVLRGLRTWWFALAFLCIGLETRFRELVSMEQGRPAVAFLAGQGANIVWTLVVATALFGGGIFAVPDL